MEGTDATDQPAPEAHPFLTAERIEKAGRISADLLMSDSSWVERRKEAVEILDDAALRRQVAVDFSLRSQVEPLEHGTSSSPLGEASPPEDRDVGSEQADPLFCAPVFVLPKSPANLMDFDLVDERGVSLRLQSRQDNARVSAETLRGCARAVLGLDSDARLGEALDRRIGAIATADAPTGKLLADRLLRDPNGGGELIRLQKDDRFCQWLRTFAHSSLCVVLYRAPRHQRKLVKLSFTGPISPWKDSWRVRLGLEPYRLVVHIPLLEARSFHFEARSPTGLKIRDAKLSDSERPGAIEEKGLLRRVHLYRSSAHRSGAGTAVLWLTVGGRGFLTGAALVSLVTLVTLIAFCIEADKIAVSDSSAPSLLMILPGVIASYLARPDRHRLTARLLSSVRLLLFISAVCAFVAAGRIALAGPIPPDSASDRESDLLFFFVPLAVVAGSVFATLLMARFRSRESKGGGPLEEIERASALVDERPNVVSGRLKAGLRDVVPSDYKPAEEGPVTDDAEDGLSRYIFLDRGFLGTSTLTIELRPLDGVCGVRCYREYERRHRWLPVPQGTKKDSIAEGVVEKLEVEATRRD